MAELGGARPIPFSNGVMGDLHAHGRDAVESFTRKKTITSRFCTSGKSSGAYFVES